MKGLELHFVSYICFLCTLFPSCRKSCIQSPRKVEAKMSLFITFCRFNRDTEGLGYIQVEKQLLIKMLSVQHIENPIRTIQRKKQFHYIIAQCQTDFDVLTHWQYGSQINADCPFKVYPCSRPDSYSCSGKNKWHMKIFYSQPKYCTID